LGGVFWFSPPPPPPPHRSLLVHQEGTGCLLFTAICVYDR
jgi:hypothetical protein